MPRRRRSSPGRRVDPLADPYLVLGLAASATLAEVDAARRALAKSSHPDVGGSVERMQLINAAADEATRRIVNGEARSSWERTTPSRSPSPAARPENSNVPDPWSRRSGRHDHPSFTIEALPVEAFEAILLVAGWLGDVIDDDPPYAIEVALGPPIAGWCRLDVVPDAGASTVSLAVAAEPGGATPDLDAVRDAWVHGLNQLDWTDLGGYRSQP